MLRVNHNIKSLQEKGRQVPHVNFSHREERPLETPTGAKEPSGLHINIEATANNSHLSYVRR